MACFHPIHCHQSRHINAQGKKAIIFKCLSPWNFDPITLPCGSCIGCRLERSRQWAIRCMHEAKLHENNCFITLTYNDTHIPFGDNLILQDFQNFMKRLRKKYVPKNPYTKGTDRYDDFKTENAIRFYHCGEYGPKLGRPHFHACIFNFDFNDQKQWKPKTKYKEAMYRSQSLEKLWSKKLTGFDKKSSIGYSSVQPLTFKSAAYCARYIMKKQSGDQAKKHYTVDASGTDLQKNPEYNTMSRNPGISKHYFNKFHTDWYPDDFIIIDGNKHRPPAYYDSQYELLYPSEMEQIKINRLAKADKPKALYNRTPERLQVREEIQKIKLTKLKRDLQ